MRSGINVLLMATAVLLQAATLQAQQPEALPPADQEVRLQSPETSLAQLQKDVADLRSQLAAAQGAAQQDEKQKQQLQLLQKQIEKQQQMIELLLEQVKKGPLAGPAAEKLESRVASLEARTRQAAQRDQDLAQAMDNLSEHLDAVERNGPRLPETLKELFLPSRTNETPLSIYGQIFGTYRKFPHNQGAGEFSLDEFDPWFLVQLNDWILLEVELFVSPGGAGVDQGQIDFLVNDWLTVVAGRFIAPTGWFNERAHPAWINKLPDFPLVLRQVAPADYSLNGVQLRGARQLDGLPLKLEYSAYAANGFGLPGMPSFTDVANIEAQKESTADINEAMAYGGRLGLWYPELGLEAGASVFFNSPYFPLAGSDIQLWQLDFNYHKGNWDVRFEYADMRQGTSGLTDESIRRFGYYAQLAYRPYHVSNRLLQRTELVARYSRARFHGIDPTAIDFSAFDTPIDIPVNRNQYTLGINYYVYPSLLLKFAYEINHERNDIHLKDDVFFAQVAWGF
jgi:hypothetical protein